MAEDRNSPSALEIVRTRSLASLVGQELEAMILDGRLPAGERLNEQQLALRLGVSRGPVREAVRGLERSGLVVSVRNQGSYVRSISAAEALEIYDLRAALTGFACARLAGAATPAQLRELGALVRRMEAAREADAAPAYYAANLEFHAALLTHGGGPRGLRIYEDLGNELHLFRRRALVEPENMRESNAEHAAILAAIAAGDAEAARAAGEAHIAGGKRRFQATDASGAGHPPARTPTTPQQAVRKGAKNDEEHRKPAPPEPAVPAAGAARPRRRAGRTL
ncbi:FCD domain-containing protein [Falsiroseomonas sp.]|uniref:FCD domain-containing protein n=1 Tax=Falsiroseomonas sp. TaxID=2870721 RepID=UPI003F715D37